MTSSLGARATPAWILSAGLAMVCLGLVAESKSQNPPVPPGQAQPQTQSLPLSQGFATSDSNGQMIAVTGIDVTGGSLLFLIDTQSRHLSVYSAQGGTSSTANLKWLGARNIDLDLQVDGFNDRSEYKYKALAQEFAESGSSAASGD